jgi:hypothetical protein
MNSVPPIANTSTDTIAEKAINRDLYAIVRSSNPDVTGLVRTMHMPVGVKILEMNNFALSKEPFGPFMDAVHAVLLKGLNHENATYAAMLSTMKSACMEIFLIMVGARFGEQTSQLQDGRKQVTIKTLAPMQRMNYLKYCNAANEAFVRKRYHGGNMMQHVVAYLATIGLWFIHPKNMSPDLRSAMFPDEVVMMFIISMGPLCYLDYVYKFSIHVEGGRKNVYDDRYSKIIILKSMVDICLIMISLYNGPKFVEADSARKIDDLARLCYRLYVDFSVRENVATGDRAMKTVYDRIQKLSDYNLNLSVFRSRLTDRLTTQKADAQAMYTHQLTDKRRTRNAKIQFILWVVAYVFIVVSALYLVISSKHDAFLTQAIIILVLLTIMIILQKLYDIFLSKFPTFNL